MKQEITLEQIAELPIVRDYLQSRLAGGHEAQRQERVAMIVQLRNAEAECMKIDAEAEEARKALEVATKAWESARGTCGAIAAKRTAAGARYQRAHKNLLALGERTIEDAIRKIGLFKTAIDNDVLRIEGVLQRDAALRPHEQASRIKPTRRRELMLELNAHKAALQPLTDALVSVEGMRLTEMSPGDIVEQIAAIIENAGLDTTNITGLQTRQAA